MNYILNGQPAHNPWTLLRPDTDANTPLNVPPQPSILPFEHWQNHPELHQRTDIGIWLQNTTEPEHHNIDWNRFPVIALDYPKFTDGRSHSIAYLLRNRHGYTGELRAIGDILVDQLYYMQRVGINGFELRADQNLDSALRMLTPYTQTYQGSTDNPQPAYTRNDPQQQTQRQQNAQHDHGLAAKTTTLEHTLSTISREHPDAILASSLALEDMVLTDIIARHKLPITIITLQTGMLHPQTTQMIDTVRQHYGIDIQTHTPDPQATQTYIQQHGQHAFYQSIDLRKQCCDIRKVQPLKQALKGKSAWITGQRAEQNITRASIAVREHDHTNGLTKYNPLRDWTLNDIKHYIQHHQVPYNPLHDQGYPSIGCEPCTRAIKPNEDQRAGRWWWEHNDSKECGLHQSPAIQTTQEDTHD